jgi:hypothetical protein
MRSPHAPAPSVRKPEARSSSPGRLALYCALVGAPFFAVAVLLQARGPIGLTAGIVAGVLLLLAVFLNMPGVDLEEMSSGRVRNDPGDPGASDREPPDEE